MASVGSVAMDTCIVKPPADQSQWSSGLTEGEAGISMSVSVSAGRYWGGMGFKISCQKPIKDYVNHISSRSLHLWEAVHSVINFYKTTAVNTTHFCLNNNMPIARGPRNGNSNRTGCSFLDWEMCKAFYMHFVLYYVSCSLYNEIDRFNINYITY